jgi:lipoate-protein ligase A
MPNSETLMHGAYKTPGGKLVAVDFDVDGGRLNHVVLHGDFFLYPEDAIFPITEALEGMPADLIESEIAARVRSAIPPGTEMLGFSPEAIGIAVQRALVQETESTNG